MTSRCHNFHLSGPSHLTVVDWGSAYHRRSVAASLVQSVYVLQEDRHEKRQGPNALASPWWQFFGFEFIRQLVDDVDSSIFGAIYEFKPPSSGSKQLAQGVPKYVIAFRGTVLKGDTQDPKLDVQCIINGLHRTSRFEIAMQAVQNTVAAYGASNIWIAGHSLGSAMGMLAGKNMAKTGIFLEAFLFNQPFISACAPAERIKHKKVKQGIRMARSIITAGVTVAVKGQHQKSQSDNSFTALSAWAPSLFVHPTDLISSGYIGYFDHRKKMNDIGAGRIEKLATQNSVGSLLLNLVGRESDPLHLLPSANLTTNLTPAADFRQAHGIQQWWRSDLHLQSKMYKY